MAASDALEPALDEDACACRDAVVRAFWGMCARGAAVEAALATAARVYRFHHPEAACSDVREIVASWVTDGPHGVQGCGRSVH